MTQASIVKRSDIFVLETCAVDTDNIRQAFSSIHAFVVKQLMQATGLDTIIE
jgi:hypothetical protein